MSYPNDLRKQMADDALIDIRDQMLIDGKLTSSYRAKGEGILMFPFVAAIVVAVERVTTWAGWKPINVVIAGIAAFYISIPVLCILFFHRRK
jgi:hypothetical protein